jgi:integrase/recombinase XerD
MSALAPTLEAFFTERLLTQRRVSPRTVAAYRDSLRLLLDFAHVRTGKLPCHLDLADLDTELVEAFLTHLERDRHNAVRTRNARLAAIHSLFRYAALRHPEHAALIGRVLAIPVKRYDRALVSFLTTNEIDALLAAPDRGTWIGCRDHALLVLAVQTGLRVSELARLTAADLQLGHGPHVKCHGKGRKERATPLTKQTVAVLRVWLRERAGADIDPLFPTGRGEPLSVDAIQWLLAKHARTAARNCQSLRAKRVSPHVLRHSCAVNLLRAGVDTAVIALWLGHSDVRTTAIYLSADLALKERALARTAPLNTTPGRYRPPDALLAFLDSL